MPRRVAPLPGDLSRRERQILDVLYRLGRGSAGDVRAHLPDAPTETAVRTLLRILEDKGHVRHARDGARNVYSPTVPREAAQRSAIRHLLGTLFGGSATAAMAALLDVSERDLSADERRELVTLIESARARDR
jgi:predicted transcriptional regulator